MPSLPSSVAGLLALCLPLLGCDPGRDPAPVTEPTGEIDAFIEEALAAPLAAARREPERGDLRGMLGLAYEANEMWVPAKQAFQNAAALDPEAPEWPFHVAIASYQMGESDEADAIVTELAARHPGFGPARYRHGLLLFERGEFARARDEFRATRSLAPPFHEALVSEAETELQLDDPERALELADRALAEDPELRRANHVRGLALRALGRKQEAERELALGAETERSYLTDQYARLLEGYRAGFSVQIGTAVSLLESGRAAEAVRLLEKLRGKKPTDLNLLNNLAVAYRGVQKPADAARILEQAHALDPKHFPTLINLSGCYWETEDYEAALEAANEGVSLVPANGQVHFAKGRALIALERREEARVALAEAARLDPNSVDVLGIHADNLMKLYRFDEALGHWERVCEIAPDHLPGRYNLCRCQLQLGKLDDARVTYQALRRMAPSNQAVGALGKELGL